MENTQKILSAVKVAVLEIAPNAKIILFGSRSRDDYTVESDWDFLILTETKPTDELKKKIRSVLYDIELNTSQAISVLIHSKEEWNNLQITPLYQNIEDEGELV